MAQQSQDGLNEAHKKFAESYILDWNGTRAYMEAYPGVKEETARANASRLLTNANIKAYIKEIQQDLEKQAGISRLGLALELKKIAYSSIAHLHLNWLERKEFDQLTDDQKACISEIDTKVLKKNIGTADEPEIVDVEYIKVKLYDKQKAIEGLRKMLGYDAAEKVHHSGEMSITWNEEKTYDK